MHEYTKLALDHTFEGVKVLVSTFVKVVALYFTVLAIYFGALNYQFGSSLLISNLRIFCILWTFAMFPFFGIFYLLVRRGIAFYFRFAIDECKPIMAAELQRIERDFVRSGVFLLVAGNCVFAIVLIVLLQSPVQ